MFYWYYYFIIINNVISINNVSYLCKIILYGSEMQSIVGVSLRSLKYATKTQKKKHLELQSIIIHVVKKEKKDNQEGIKPN